MVRVSRNGKVFTVLVTTLLACFFFCVAATTSVVLVADPSTSNVDASLSPPVDASLDEPIDVVVLPAELPAEPTSERLMLPLEGSAIEAEKFELLRSTGVDGENLSAR